MSRIGKENRLIELKGGQKGRAGIERSELPKGLPPKGGSAVEGQTLFRGGKDIDKVKITESGVSFSTSKDVAVDFAKERGGNVKGFTLSPEAKIVDYGDIPNVKFKDLDSQEASIRQELDQVRDRLAQALLGLGITETDFAIEVFEAMIPSELNALSAEELRRAAWFFQDQRERSLQNWLPVVAHASAPASAA